MQTFTIKSGDRVTIVDRFGKEHTGRAVMLGSYGWVLNMGGPHGTPAIANSANTVRVSRGRRGAWSVR
jgi:hypothetical protein